MNHRLNDAKIETPEQQDLFMKLQAHDEIFHDLIFIDNDLNAVDKFWNETKAEQDAIEDRLLVSCGMPVFCSSKFTDIKKYKYRGAWKEKETTHKTCRGGCKKSFPCETYNATFTVTPDNALIMHEILPEDTPPLL